MCVCVWGGGVRPVNRVPRSVRSFTSRSSTTTSSGRAHWSSAGGMYGGAVQGSPVTEVWGESGRTLHAPRPGKPCCGVILVVRRRVEFVRAGRLVFLPAVLADGRGDDALLAFELEIILVWRHRGWHRRSVLRASAEHRLLSRQAHGLLYSRSNAPKSVLGRSRSVETTLS